jgi:hypothetical protein
MANRAFERLIGINRLAARKWKKADKRLRGGAIRKSASAELLQADLCAVELLKQALVHGIHQFADAGRLAHPSFAGFDPHIFPGSAERLGVVEIIDTFMQALAGFGDCELDSHEGSLSGCQFR